VTADPHDPFSPAYSINPNAYPLNSDGEQYSEQSSNEMNFIEDQSYNATRDSNSTVEHYNLLQRFDDSSEEWRGERF